MIVVIDSGSSKAEWIFSDGRSTVSLETMGLNPRVLGEGELSDTVRQVKEKHAGEVSQVYFYGAGCSTEDSQAIVRNAIQRSFPKSTIEVNSDIMGAAVATCGSEPGIVGILGTGSNSVYYDGRELHPNNFGLGYILADEGGGFDLGKSLVTAFLYETMPEDLRKSFFKKFALTREVVLREVYNKPSPNAWLASFAMFPESHRGNAWMEQLLEERFAEFFRLYVLCYPQHREVPLHFVGSIAKNYRDVIERIAGKNFCMLGKILQKPAEALLHWHLNPVRN